MANSNFRYRSQFNFSWSAKPVTLRAVISIGASGAPSIVANTSMGIASVVRNSTGDYTIALSHAYGSLMSVKHIFNSGASAPAAPGMYIKANSVSSATAPSIEVVTNAAGTAADPASGEILYVEIELNESSQGF